MTLFKQISLLIVSGFILLYVLLSLDSLKQSGSVLNNQLRSSAQDTATVLGVSITTTGAMSDSAQMETLLNTVFDSGYYSHINLLSMDGATLFEKSRDLSAEGVPSWFAGLVDIYPSTGTAKIMQGWAPAGELNITLHPGFVYRDLYDRSISTLIWFSSTFVIILSLLWVFLHSLLKPLSEMERQAKSAEENRFERLDLSSKTIEFKRIIGALNRLSVNAQRVYFDQQVTLKELNVLRFQDPLTGLKNRRYMMSELDRMASEDSAFVGCLFLVKLEEVADLRARQAYEQADEKVMRFASLISKTFEGAGGFAVGKISDDEFLVLVENTWSDTETLLNKLIDTSKSSDNVPSVQIAGCELGRGEAASDLLSKLDLALAQAESDSSTHLQFIEAQDPDLPSGKSEWRAWFEKKIEQREFFLAAQSVFDKQEKVLHRELFIRAREEGKDDMPASTFMPMAASLNLASVLDGEVFTMLCDVPEMRRETCMSVNLSDASVVTPEIINKIDVLLEAYKDKPATLCFEIAHVLWLKYPKESRVLADKVRDAGQLIGVDHFALDWSIDFLRDLQPEYIKLNALLLDDLASVESASGYRALRNLTYSLNIKLIAVGIDDPSLHTRLQALSLDGLQGNLLAKSARLV